MTGLITVLFLVTVLDQAVKLLVLRRLGTRSVCLGPLGELRVVNSRIWLARWVPRVHGATVWGLWCWSAAVLAFLCSWFAMCGWFAGALLGGSLSHAIDTSLRGSVRDYVCLRCWPAFNLADVAITVGAFGVALRLLMVIGEAWS